MTTTTRAIIVNGQTFSPDAARTISIGRTAESDVVVDHPAVSRRHATLGVDERGWVFHDAASTNGSFVDAIRVSELIVVSALDVMLGSPHHGGLLAMQFADTPPKPAEARPVAPVAVAQAPIPDPIADPIAAPNPGPAPIEEVAERPEVSWVVSPLLLAGVALVVVGGFLPWFTGSGLSVSGWDVPLRFVLVDPAAADGPTVGVFLLLALLALVPALRRRPTPAWLSLLLAAVVTAPVLGSVNRVVTLDDGPDLGIGIVVALVGALALAGASWRRARTP